MIKTLLNFLKRKPKTHSSDGFLLRENDFWYTGEWMTHRYDECQAGRPWKSAEAPWPIEGKIAFNPYKCIGGDTSGLINGLIPAIRLGDNIGLYEAKNLRRNNSGSDLAGWDDAMLVDLVFIRSCPVSIIEALRSQDGSVEGCGVGG